MIFTHTWKAILEGRKVQTRRLINPGEELEIIGAAKWVDNRNKPWKGADNCFYTPYSTGHTYAVQPGRGKKAIARIRITDIRCEDVRAISDEDVKAEGFENAMYFFSTWLTIHDPSIQLKARRGQSWDLVVNRKLEYWDATLEHVRDLMQTRPAEKYQCWALTFELVKDNAT